MPPDKNERRPLARSAAQDVVHRDGSSLTQAPDKIADPTGCVCGHLYDDECIRHTPAPDRDGHCCRALDADQLAAAVRRGWHCAAPAGCVRRRLVREVSRTTHLPADELRGVPA